MKGSFTIEASIVFPVVFLSVIAIIYFGIYIHDKTFLQSVANEGVLIFEESIYRGDDYGERLDGGLYIYSKKDGTLESEVEQYIVDKVKNRLLFNPTASHLGVNCKVNNYLIYKEVLISISNDFTTSLPFVNELLAISSGEPFIYVESRAKLHNREEIVRTVDFLDDTTAKIEGIKTFRDSYNGKVEEITNIISVFID